MKYLVIFLFMLFLSWEDIRKKEVSSILLLGFLIGGIGYRGAVGIQSSLFYGVLPGILLLLTGKLSNWAAGPADGIVTGILGFYLTIWEITGILWITFLFAAIVSAYLEIIKKKEKTYEIPFIPFLTAGVFLSRIIK